MGTLSDQLLADIDKEEVINPDAGVYDNAIFDGGEIGITKNGGFQFVAHFSIPRIGAGGHIKHREYIDLPQAESHSRVKQIGLGWYRALGIVPEGSKAVPMATNRATADKVVAALNSSAGCNIAISLVEDDSGFLRARPMRGRK